MTINELILKLNGVKKRHQNAFMARCPAHDDRSLSLSIKQENGKILLKCFSGCNLSEILDALGLQASDLFTDSLNRAISNPESVCVRSEPSTEQIARWASKANMAAKLWNAAKPISHSQEHPYLLKKQVEPYGLRVLPVWRTGYFNHAGKFIPVTVNDALLVPVFNQHSALRSLQAIFPNKIEAMGRDKDFLAGSELKRCFYWVAARTPDVCLAEGYSTAYSVHKITGLRCYIAFSAGNLLHVAEIIRRNKPDAKITICGDRDINGVGERAAKAAALAVGGRYSLPPCSSDVNADWNDFVAGGDL